jgi:copper chaperone
MEGESIMKKLMLIEGMSCGHCVNHVKNALEDIAQVSSAVVDLESKNAVVDLKEDVDDDILKEAVEEAGYDVKEIKKI